MYPIYSTKRSSIGYLYDEFISELKKTWRECTKTHDFVFIFHSGTDVITHIVNNESTFLELDRISGEKLSIYYFNEKDDVINKEFNTILKELLSAETELSLPFMIIGRFDSKTKSISKKKLVPLCIDNENIIYKDIYVNITNWIKNDNVQRNTTKDDNKDKLLKYASEKFIDIILSKVFTSALGI